MSKATLIAVLLTSMPFLARATELKVGDAAPEFKAPAHDGTEFDLNSHKGQWTVLYFYPKSFTPGCTKQACAFRDNIKKVRAEGAEVYGISADTVDKQKEFHEAHHLNFPLLADPDAKVIDSYGAKMPVMKMAKRWTFIIDPDLKIRAIDHDVDPVADADHVAAKLASLKKK